MLLVRQVSARRSCLFILVALALGILGVAQAAKPIRLAAAKRYAERGTARFIAQDYAGAVNEYGASLRYDPANREILADRALAQSAETDPLAAEPFFIVHNVQDALTRLQRAQGPFATAKDAAAAGIELLNEGQPVYARYSLQQATVMDPAYPDGWNYLGVDYQALAKIDPAYAAKATAAFAKRDALTPKYLKNP